MGIIVECLGLAALILVLATPKAAHAVAAALVQVTNTTASPVITSKMDDPGRIPYQQTMQVGPTICGAGVCIFSTVPPGHRLVIQHVSVQGLITGPGTVQAYVGVNGYQSSFLVPTAFEGSFYGFAEDEPVLLFLDAGSFPEVGVILNIGSAQSLGYTISLSGYLLYCSAAPCSAIAN